MHLKIISYELYIFLLLHENFTYSKTINRVYYDTYLLQNSYYLAQLRTFWIIFFTFVNKYVIFVYKLIKKMTPEAERFNGWAAMLGFVAAVGAYVTTGQIIPGWF